MQGYEIAMKMHNNQRYAYVYAATIIVYVAIIMLIYIQKRYYQERDELDNLKKNLVQNQDKNPQETDEKKAQIKDAQNKKK